MKRTAIVLSAVAILFARGEVVAQEVAEEPNVHYEKLKVLEPLIGSWQSKGENTETGAKWEAKANASWSDSKRVIEVEVIVRLTDPDGEIEVREWAPHYYVYNSEADRIELFIINTRNGEVFISEVKVGKDGVVTYPRIRTTRKGGFTGHRTDTLTDTTWTSKFHDSKDVDGNAIDDLEVKREKVTK